MIVRYGYGEHSADEGSADSTGGQLSPAGVLRASWYLSCDKCGSKLCDKACQTSCCSAVLRCCCAAASCRRWPPSQAEGERKVPSNRCRSRNCTWHGSWHIFRGNVWIDNLKQHHTGRPVQVFLSRGLLYICSLRQSFYSPVILAR